MSVGLIKLPQELRQQILSYLRGPDLAGASRACRWLNEGANDDLLWRALLSTENVDHKVVVGSPRKIYSSLHPFWFLLRHRIWFSNRGPYGKLILVRYNRYSNVLEGYTLNESFGERRFLGLWNDDPRSHIISFDPLVELDLNVPVLRIDAETHAGGQANGVILGGETLPNEAERNVSSEEHESTLQKEFTMNVHENTEGQAGLFSALMLTKALPSSYGTTSSSVWPPSRIPAAERVRNQSQNGFRGLGHRPRTSDEICEHAFRIRKQIGFRYGTSGGIGFGLPEEVSTWATLPIETYTPTVEKPYRGIWAGDYTSHGVEFLLLSQPDQPTQLPEAALEVSHGMRSDETVATHPTESGSIEAVKLTGDPNIPCGEYTWIAPDVSQTIGVADNPIVKDARIVRSFGHIRDLNSPSDQYVPCKLILISHDRIAQAWQFEEGEHLAFYSRVDINSFPHTFP